MSTEKALATPDQARELLDEVIAMMDRKGHRFATGSEVYWRGEKITLPPNIRERTKTSEDDAQNFHISAVLSGATALKELAIVTFTSLKPIKTGLNALRYKVVPHTGLQDLSLECHGLESLFPRIPIEREAELLEMEEGAHAHSDSPTQGLDDPIAFGRALIESASVNMFRHEIEGEEREAKERALGKFATTASEADELIVLISNFTEV